MSNLQMQPALCTQSIHRNQVPGARALRWRAAAAACSRAASSTWNAADEGSSSGLWQALSRLSLRRTCERSQARNQPRFTIRQGLC